MELTKTVLNKAIGTLRGIVITMDNVQTEIEQAKLLEDKLWHKMNDLEVTGKGDSDEWDNAFKRYKAAGKRIDRAHRQYSNVFHIQQCVFDDFYNQTGVDIDCIKGSFEIDILFTELHEIYYRNEKSTRGGW